MPQFYLFVDTETSGLPKNWLAPYTRLKAWPNIIQIAWIIYDEHFREVKRENYFINNNDFTIENSSAKIHHLTSAYLLANGKDRSVAMVNFERDLQLYRPIIIGHFMALDFHMINVEFVRINKTTIFNQSTFFCTMKASKPFVKKSGIELLKLNEFYVELFDEAPQNFHNALADALNTAKIFFHLLKKGHIDAHTIQTQKHDFIHQQKSGLSKTKKFIKRLFSIVFYG